MKQIVERLKTIYRWMQNRSVIKEYAGEIVRTVKKEKKNIKTAFSYFLPA